MRKLENQSGVQSPSSDYPKGRVVDSQTLMSEAIFGDMISAWQKMVEDAGFTENDKPDNVTNGFQLLEALYAKIKEKVLSEVTDGLLTKVIEIGTWDMDSLLSVNVTHGLGTSWNKVRSINVLIQNDNQDSISDLNSYYIGSGRAGMIDEITSTVISLKCLDGGKFNNTFYDSTSINRGWITIQYV